MFARFNAPARRVIELAEEQARAQGSPGVGPEHLLLALLENDRGRFRADGLDAATVRSILWPSIPGEPPPRPSPPGHLPMRIREVLRQAFRHSALLGSDDVGPLHLAFVLFDDPPGEIAFVLRRTGLDADRLRDSILAELDGRTRVVVLPRYDEEDDAEGDIEGETDDDRSDLAAGRAG